MVLVLVYAASLPSLLNILTEPWQRGVLMAVLGAGLLGLAALFLLDHLPRPLMGLRLIAPIAELSRESRRLFTHPARCGAVLGLSALSIALTILAFKFVADGVGSRLSLGSWIMIVPPVTLIQLLPISLAGWGGPRSGAGRRACFVWGSGRGGAGNVGAAGFVSDSHRLAWGSDLARRLGRRATAAHTKTFPIGR